MQKNNMDDYQEIFQLCHNPSNAKTVGNSHRLAPNELGTVGQLSSKHQNNQSQIQAFNM